VTTERSGSHEPLAAWDLGASPSDQKLTIFGLALSRKRHWPPHIQKNGDYMKRLTADHVKVGFIGLGNMGSRIARRLLDHGYQLSVYDRDLAKTEAIGAHGGVVATSILEMARTADVLLSCLTNDEAVRSVYAGPRGCLPGQSREPLCSR
jgi:phosphoglycerate dehydrogenase-like enzyme